MYKTLLSGCFIGAIAMSTACVEVNAPANGGGAGTTSSGVTPTKRATDFSPAEKKSFCEWFTDLAADKVGDYDCGNGITITIDPYTEAECNAELASNPQCPVAQLEACFRAIVNDPCLLASESAPPQCAKLAQCADGGGDDGGGDDGGGDDGGGDDGGTTEYCYDHNCNGDATGKKCFETTAKYCDSLCEETNCISVAACESECF